MDPRSPPPTGTPAGRRDTCPTHLAPHTHEHVFYSTATPEERRRTRATDGRLTKDKLVALSVPADATAYVCGPASFMADMQYALTTAGIDPARIHTELGRGHAFDQPWPHGAAARTPHQPPGPPGTGPLVTFARSGISVTFPDSKLSVLELADACDVPTRSGPHPTATCSSAVPSPAQHRRRPRHVRPANTMTTPAPQPDRADEDKRTAAAPADLDPIAVAPAIGPMPAVYIPRSSNKACAAHGIWHTAARAACDAQDPN